MLKLSAIYIYPVKSMPAVALKEAEARGRGLAGDRRWMLTDAQGRFISLREERKLLSFRISDAGDSWKIERENNSMYLPCVPDQGEMQQVRIWDDEVLALEGKREWSDWFSHELERECRLVYMSPDSHRPVRAEWQLENEEVSFADGYPYLIINEASVRELESQTEEKMDILRFRPNLVIAGGESNSEFFYRELSAGSAVFNGLKPCARCVVTTLDPNTGAQGVEPLRTLARNKINGKVVFGQHASLKEAGKVRVGDEVKVLRFKDSPYGPL